MAFHLAYYFFEGTTWPWQLLWGKTINWCWLTVQKFNTLLSLWEALWHTGRHGLEGYMKALTCTSIGSRKRQWHTGPGIMIEISKASPIDTLPPTCQKYFSKFTSPNSAISCEPMGAKFFQSARYGRHSIC